MNFISRFIRALFQPKNYVLCFIFCIICFHSYCLLFGIPERFIDVPEGSNQKIDVSENVDSSLPSTRAETDLKISGDHSGLEKLDILQNRYEHIEEEMKNDVTNNYEIEYIEQYSDENNIQVYMENYNENYELYNNEEKQMDVKEEQEMLYADEKKLEGTEEKKMEDTEEKNNNIDSTNDTMHNNLRIHIGLNQRNVSEDTINKISSEYVIHIIFENIMKMTKEVISLFSKAFLRNIEKEKYIQNKNDTFETNYSDLESTLRIMKMISYI
ncbi:probable protein, unknown function [Plasmodium sp. gorilla clade G2]|uniref:probable protein, unknown function n=1 Tax=Plasmodium sp. gorilla clade G2 TaxID=880535 RepID=UPI000D228EE6|nr:probable protein, unknown function [Plasmodium sp. gorilla clade G2]SOV19980.1 probable protein, unknown function [Plasmodium sp. gorilla clade G2]